MNIYLKKQYGRPDIKFMSIYIRKFTELNVVLKWEMGTRYAMKRDIV